MSVYKMYNENGLCYYGSTKNDLKQRLSKHKSDYNLGKCAGNSAHKLFCENQVVNIELMEELENLEDLGRRERFYIENNECVNKRIPTRTQYEYRQDNLQRIKPLQNEYSKNYYKRNKERILKNLKDKYNKEKCQD